jgi:hypothetical protein
MNKAMVPRLQYMHFPDEAGLRHMGLVHIIHPSGAGP